MKRAIFTIIFLNLLNLNLSAQILSEWRGIGRAGVYENEKNLLSSWPASGPELIWSVDSIPVTYSSVAVVTDAIFTTGLKDTLEVLMKFDKSGKLLWETVYGNGWMNSFSESRCTPTVEAERVYVSSGMGEIACIDANNGEIIWKHDALNDFESEAPKFGFSESILVDENYAYYTPGGNITTIVAYNKQTGQLSWKSESLQDKPSYTSAKMIKHNGIKQIVTLSENYVFGTNPKNGKIAWKFNFGEYVITKNGRKGRNNQTNTPLYYKGELYITSGYDHKSVMLKLNEDASAVSLVYVDSILDNHFGGVVRVGDYIYGANWKNNSMGDWVCMEWETGKIMWTKNWENKGSIISADGMLYCYEEKRGNIALVKATAEKFEVISSFKVPLGKGPHWGHLVINDGKLYIRHSHAIMVYNLKN